MQAVKLRTLKQNIGERLAASIVTSRSSPRSEFAALTHAAEKPDLLAIHLRVNFGVLA